MKLSEELTWRGYVNQTTFKDLNILDGAPLSFYWGVDPSASSMTVGNLAAAMMVRRFIEHGHKAVLLVGGATGLIGDPDGKKQERDLKSVEELEKNITSIANQYKTIFAGEDFELVNNNDWFKKINYLDFLRDIGKHLSMTQLLDREFVKTRIGEGGSGISYAEFSYSLIQGYDFLHLFKEKNVTLQVCGADQWGNSLAGVEMIRKFEGKEAHVYSTPLIVNKTTGVKFGKSEDGAIWLDAALTSPYKFYQFWLNVDDAGVGEYIKVYTLIQPEEYEALMTEFQQSPQDRAAQKYLAYEVTKLIHGEKTAESVKRVSEVLFGQEESSKLSAEDLDALAQEIPTRQRVPTSVSGKDSTPSTTISEALLETGVVNSLGEARRLIEGNAISVDGIRVTKDEILQRSCLIKKGKNTFILVK